MRKKKKKPLHIGGNYASRPLQPVAYGWCLYSRLTGELFGTEGPVTWIFRTKPEAIEWKKGMFFATDYVARRVRVIPGREEADATVRLPKKRGRRTPPKSMPHRKRA